MNINTNEQNSLAFGESKDNSMDQPDTQQFVGGHEDEKINASGRIDSDRPTHAPPRKKDDGIKPMTPMTPI